MHIFSILQILQTTFFKQVNHLTQTNLHRLTWNCFYVLKIKFFIEESRIFFFIMCSKLFFGDIFWKFWTSTTIRKKMRQNHAFYFCTCSYIIYKKIVFHSNLKLYVLLIQTCNCNEKRLYRKKMYSRHIHFYFFINIIFTVHYLYSKGPYSTFYFQIEKFPKYTFFWTKTMDKHPFKCFIHYLRVLNWKSPPSIYREEEIASLLKIYSLI